MKRTLNLILLVLLLLTACTPGADTLAPTSETQSTAMTTEAQTATPTEEPVAVLNVCTVSLPVGLYPYDGKNPIVKNNLLAMVGLDIFPSTEENGGKALLTGMPTQENGGITLQSVNVQLGETVVDADGELVVLKAGVTVRPSGCRSADCATIWDGTEALSMDRMHVVFHLSDGLTWSDGTPFTAADSVFSFELASDSGAPGLQWMESRTGSYSAVSNNEILWIGKPGFTTAEIEDLFWQPLPSHQFIEGATWDAIAEDPLWSGAMASLGRYQVSAWTEDEIQLGLNGYYAAAEGAQPDYGEINFRVIPELDVALAAYASGACDVLDQSYHLERDAAAVEELQADSQTTLIRDPNSSWTQLVFGIKPASYDEYYNPVYGDRPDFFGDVRTRQAVAACLDREAIQLAVTSGLAELWPSFMSPGDSTLAADQQLNHDPEMAMQLLEAVGWRDHDLDPSTPLQAWYVDNVPSNTTFSLNFYVEPSTTSQQVAAIVQSSLGECGIEVTPVTLPASQLFAAGPDGILFGRQFDLALIGWSPLPQADCALYESDQVPTSDNQWIGTNIAGLTEIAYDSACNAASLALPGEWTEALTLAETQYLSYLPSIPLFTIPGVIAVEDTACQAVNILWGNSLVSGLNGDGADSICP